MTTFIDELVEHLLQSQHKLSSIQLILPSKRAGTLLKKNIVKRLEGTTAILPLIRSIEELIVDMSGLASASQTQLQFEMYKAYLQTHTDNPDTFIEFLAWAPGVLGDFNEIDRYLLPTDFFFDYLTAIKEMDYWQADPEPTAMVKNYLTFWEQIALFYDAFNKVLQAQGLGYQGMQYREAAAAAEIYTTNSRDHYIFAGFNALNNAEQHIIQSFLKNNASEIIWDIDSHFLSDMNYNAGRFIREYLKDWKYFKDNSIHKGLDCYKNRKDIQSIAISGSIGQAKYVGQQIAGLSQEELENTAIVLGDEALLLPLLSSLPENVVNINITMGLPLNQVPDASFFDAWLSLHDNIQNSAFICRDLLSFLTQSHSELLLENSTSSIRKKIESENLIRITSDELIRICVGEEDVARALFQSWDTNAKKAIDASLEVIKMLKNRLIPSKNWLQLEYLFAFQEIFGQLADLSKSYQYLSDIKSLLYFYRELLSKETLDFRGDPYAGLQIMGVLESRVLDFKNVIITGLNEGTLPSGKSQGSFIPFDLKKEYKLPTYREKDAIYAYHFFRLIQRAEHIYLVYNNESTGIHSAEKSRFLLQLEIDQLPNHQFTQISANAAVTISPKTPKTIEKTPEIIEKLKAQAAYGFSPSALTTYIRNPIDFYYRYVLGIPEIDGIEDVVAHNTLGTIVHETLEQIYTDALNQELNIALLKKMRAAVPKEIQRQFEKIYNLENTKTGKNLIIYNVALKFVYNLLNKEQELLEAGNTLVITSCEQKFTATLQQEPFPINLRGTVDRMDVMNETTRIIDYKTGNVTAAELKLTDWELLTADYKKHAKAFQVLCYSLMLFKKSGLPDNLEAGVISFKNLNSGFLKFHENKSTEINEGLMNKFEGFALQLIYEILDLNTPFVEKEVS
ncbi:PD-(D/E)XK nuclease family protein [Flavimarina sp. Hel_I_48]|uniref:PD-(D/E)XK nuclease family protein n=1 Tax=Flavimarina sp. Hel_I_48 TaxID=1392488 RepID=UPI0004DF82D0|nr:PD-(D/E)XK nuclease family protein [Flavimarina sp. Hel_I_48]